MKRKIDSIKGRLIYNRRLGMAEPAFGNICSTIGLNRFTLRGKRKVNTQWCSTVPCTIYLKCIDAVWSLHEPIRIR